MERRAFEADVEIRAIAGKRLLCGILVPYGVNQRIDATLVERFEPGAFTHQFRAPDRVRLFNLHSNAAGTLPLGHGVELRDDAAGLYGEFRVVDSHYGDHFLALVREGSMRQWSIGFIPERDRMDGRVTVRTKATAREAALVPEGAYGDLAVVAAVREVIPTLTRDELLARLPPPRFPA